MQITFRVPGRPRGKGRPRFFRRGQHVGTYTDADTAAYENLVALSWAAAAPGVRIPAGVPVSMVIRAEFALPASWSKKRKAGTHAHTSRPDADNLLKAVCDGLRGAWGDDAQVYCAEVVKYYVTPTDEGLTVTVTWAETKGGGA